MKGTVAQVFLDGIPVPSVDNLGLVASTVPHIIPWCWPFQGRAESDQFYLVMYWGSLRRLATELPWVWFGARLPIVKQPMINQPLKQIVLETNDPCFIADGDMLEFCEVRPSEALKYEVQIRLGPSVTLLGYRP